MWSFYLLIMKKNTQILIKLNFNIKKNDILSEI